MGGSLHSRTHVHVLYSCSSLFLVSFAGVLCVYDICFSGCHGGEGREEGLGLGEGLGRKEEDMCVGESTKSTVHVDAEIYKSE